MTKLQKYLYGDDITLKNKLIFTILLLKNVDENVIYYWP